MASYMAKQGEVERRWLVVDVSGKVLGRCATQIADILRGKHRPTFTPHTDAGDFVVVVNADKIVVTGDKLDKKVYWEHTLFPGGEYSTSVRQMMATKPEEVIRKAVKGMLPKNHLGRELLKKLKIYVGGEHPHTAQQPQPHVLQ